MGNSVFIVQGAASALAASWAASAGSTTAVVAEAPLYDAPQFAHFETNPSQDFNRIMANFRVAPIFRMDSEIKLTSASHSNDGPGSIDGIGAPSGSGSSDGGGPRKGLMDLLRKLLHSNDSKVREKTVRKIARIGEKQDVSEAIPDLIDMVFHEEDDDVLIAMDEAAVKIWQHNRPEAISEFRTKMTKALSERDLNAFNTAVVYWEDIDPDLVAVDDFLGVLKSPDTWKDEESCEAARWTILALAENEKIKGADAVRLIEILLSIALYGYYSEPTDNPDIIHLPRLSRFEGTYRKRSLSQEQIEEEVAKLSEPSGIISDEFVDNFGWILHVATDVTAATRCEAISAIGELFAEITQSASTEAHRVMKALQKMGYERRISFLDEYAEEDEGVERVLWYQVLNTLDFIVLTDGDATVRHAAEKALEKIFAAVEDK